MRVLVWDWQEGDWVAPEGDEWEFGESRAGFDRGRVREHAAGEVDRSATTGATAAMEHGAPQLPHQNLLAAVRLLLRERTGHHHRPDR